jgi:NADH-quinone oxidoreductase subunit G
MQEMTRCIHCTRCVRFGQEIAGVMEFGMLGRGEHAEITAFVGKTVDSELSGNMIDLCPVGALTSKPFRYSARTWELSRRKSVSPHDSLGANLIVQVKDSVIKRVLPLENDATNECWLSDKDRFAYEGLNSADRLTRPMIKQDGQWQETDWQTALEYVAHGLRNIRHEYGNDAIAALAAPYSTLEELSLLQKLVRGLGSDNVDFRLRQSDTSLTGKVTPWLGMEIAEIDDLKKVFVIGSFLRKDHPLLTARLRMAVKHGAKLSLLHATDDDLLMPVAVKMIKAPSAWLAALSEVVAAVAAAKGIAAPAGFDAIKPSAEAQQTAANLIAGDAAVFLGNAAAQHPQAAQLHAAAEWIAQNTGAKFGYLTEAANTVGGYIANAAGANAQELFAQPRKAYVLLHAEPKFDSANPQVAADALTKADMVVVMSPFQHGFDYADVLLPVSPFSETSGTFINAAGRAQSFNGSAKPLGDTRPAWKVLRVLGNLLGLSGFEYETSEAIRNEILAGATVPSSVAARLNNLSGLAPQAAVAADAGLERIADVSIYSTDGIVRRAESLQMTTDAAAPKAHISTALAAKLGVSGGDDVLVKQGEGSVVLAAVVDAGLPPNVVRLAAAHLSTSTLGAMFGAITVEKA